MSSFIFFAKGLNKNVSGSMYALILLVFVTLGCSSLSEFGSDTAANDAAGPNTNAETVTNPDTDTANDSAQLDKSSPCYNEYYPVQENVTRNFRVTGSSPGTYTLVHKIDSEQDSFIETRDINKVVIENNWICTDEGLRNAEYSNTASAQNLQFKMDTLKSSGITFPKVWEENKEWTTSYEVKADLAAGPIKTVANGNIDVKNKIVSMNDTVKVEGGEFTAARVDSEIKINLTVKGTKAPAATLKLSNWYAPGIGLIKQEVESNLGNQKVEYTGAK